MADKDNEAPVIGDDNFVNVDPDFANYSNEVDRPMPMQEVEDWNVPEEFREAGEKKDDEKAEEDEKPSTSETSKPTPAPAVKPVTK